VELTIPIIDQAEWGSSKIYGDGELAGTWDPQYVVIHWGGWTEEVSEDEEDDQLRAWQRYHLGKGWRDIAYNYAVGESGKLYRLRGENPSGATSGRTPTGERWNAVAVNVVWIGGKSDTSGPSQAAQATMQRFIEERGFPVLGHQQTGKATACPGPEWLDFIENGIQPEQPPTTGVHMLIEKGHPVGATVEKIQEALIVHDPDALPRFGVDGDFGSETEKYLGLFQASVGLPLTGKLDDETAFLLI
jgi:hypothetical protein